MKPLREGQAALDQQAFDLLVVGAGGAGMATALFAGLRGARVLLIEHTEFVGGTTALSAGTAWIPGNPHGPSVNPGDSLPEAARYLDHAVGDASPRALREAFLAHGHAAVSEMEARTDVHWRAYVKHPDYISELPGSTLCGRALEPLPFDGRELGELFALVRPPIPEFTVLGGMMVDRTDIGHLLGMTRSWPSFRHACRILGRHALDRISRPRGTRLVMGNALVGRLLRSLSRLPNVSLALHTGLRRLHRPDGRVSGAELHFPAGSAFVHLTQGAVLASGGFNRDPDRRAAWLPDCPPDWCPAAPGHTGRALRAAESVGAVFGEGERSPAFWAPVSRRRRADGSLAVFPHFVMDRAKPGVLAVDRAGRRFVNESTSYHLFGLAMQAAHADRPCIPAYLICDARALRSYGLGMVRPGAGGLKKFLADGYLTEAPTLRALAERLGLAADTLDRTVREWNEFAAAGHDPQFHRGETAYQRNLGDPSWLGPNPSLGELAQAPFYALSLVPGDIGASRGLRTDGHARALDAEGLPIEGLYAVGNDMDSIMGGAYPAPGITIGPGLVFAHIAAQHAASGLRAGARG